MKSSSATTPSASTSYSRLERFQGYAFIAGAALFWGISASLGRAVFTGRLPGIFHALKPIDPLILAQSRSTFALLILAPVLFARRGKRAVIESRRDILVSLAVGILGVAASNYFYYLAIQKTNVATAIVLQYTAPIFVLAYMVVRGFQRATTRRMISVVLSVIGCAMAIGIIGPGRFRTDTIGIAAAMTAAVSFAYYNVAAAGLLQRYDRWRVLLCVLFGAAVFWIFIDPPWVIARAHYTAGHWIFMIIFSITSILIPYSFYFGGLRHLDATRAVVTSCLEPVFSIIIAAITLGELVSATQMIGMAVVLGATVFVQLPDPAAAGEPGMLVEPVD
jgi:drug/metabolite transporter (DMT)-like permease